MVMLNSWFCNACRNYIEATKCPGNTSKLRVFVPFAFIPDDADGQKPYFEFDSEDNRNCWKIDLNGRRVCLPRNPFDTEEENPNKIVTFSEGYDDCQECEDDTGDGEGGDGGGGDGGSGGGGQGGGGGGGGSPGDGGSGNNGNNGGDDGPGVGL